MNKIAFILPTIFLATMTIKNAYADSNTDTNTSATPSNPCDGILSLVDRPSHSDSACAVPFGDFDLEGGYQYLDLTGSGDPSGQNYPEAEFRIGLPLDNELAIIAPNFNTETIFPHAGWGSTVIGIKHEIGYTSNLLGAIEGLVTLPTGSNAFGSDGTGGTVNTIATYSITSSISTTAQLGVSTQTLPSLSGGQRFNSVNPDALLSWSITDRIETYAEAYGQSHTGPNQGAGFNADGGFLFQVAHNTEVDISYAQRLNGNLGGFNHYFGAGFGILF